MKSCKTEQEARDEIKQLIAGYYNSFKSDKKPFQPGDRIAYASRVFDEQEMMSLTDALLDFWLTTGRFRMNLRHPLQNGSVLNLHIW